MRDLDSDDVVEGSTSVLITIYENTSSRIAEHLAEAQHYLDLATAKLSYVNASVVSTCNLVDEWIEREPLLEEAWQSDRSYIEGAMLTLSGRLEKAVSYVNDTMHVLDNKYSIEAVKAGGTD